MSTWTPTDIRTLQALLREGKASHEIGEAMGRNASSIRNYIARNKELFMDYFQPMPGRPRHADLDKLWRGSVPYLHWTITKPWGCQCGAEPVTKN